MTTPPEHPGSPEFEPVPIHVILPDEQEVTGRLYARRQLPEGWLYLVSITLYRTPEDGHIEPVEYRMWLRPQDHLRPVDGVTYDDIPTERLPRPTVVERILGPRRPSGWVLQQLGGRRGQGQAVVHAVDCTEAPSNAPRLSLDQALSAAERPGVRLCSLCSVSAELDPVLRGFTEGFDGRADDDPP